MHNHIVRIKPQLVRKRTLVVPKNVSVVVKPAKVINVKAIQRQSQQPQLQPKPQPQPQPKPQPHVQSRPTPQAFSAVTRQKLLKTARKTTKRTEVRYVTKDPTPESTPKIANIKNKGKGKILIIVGNGPSILEANLASLKHPKIEFLTVNKPDARIWPTQYWAFFDSSQYRRNEDLWNGYEGTIFNSTAIKQQKPKSMQFKNKSGKGWSRDLMKDIHIGRSSVFASMQIAAWMNHDHVYIFGCDMNPLGIDGKLHFYGQNPDADPNTRKERFNKEAEYYDHAADILSPEEKNKFTFCSAYNYHKFIEKFKSMHHKEAIQYILDHANSLN